MVVVLSCRRFPWGGSVSCMEGLDFEYGAFFVFFFECAFGLEGFIGDWREGAGVEGFTEVAVAVVVVYGVLV